MYQILKCPSDGKGLKVAVCILPCEVKRFFHGTYCWVRTFVCIVTQQATVDTSLAGVTVVYEWSMLSCSHSCCHIGVIPCRVELCCMYDLCGFCLGQLNMGHS